MSDKDNKAVELSDQEKANIFTKEYQELCEKHGFQIIVTPVYIARDDGTFSTKLNASVGKLPKEEKK